MLEIMAHLPVPSCYHLFFDGNSSNFKDLLLSRARTRETLRKKGRFGAVREPHFRYAAEATPMGGEGGDGWRKQVR
jgi:hypothetical protein